MKLIHRYDPPALDGSERYVFGFSFGRFAMGIGVLTTSAPRTRLLRWYYFNGDCTMWIYRIGIGWRWRAKPQAN